MKNMLLYLFSGLLYTASVAQDSLKQIPLDKSPMDMSYFPDLYPLKKFQGKITTPPVVRVIYGRPQTEGRTIFGDLIKYNEIWRLGANEATEIEFFKDVKIDGKKVLKGRYTLYCIPTATYWTFIINKDTDNWGAFKYDSKKDLLRIKTVATNQDTVTEALSLYFDKTEKGAKLVVKWSNKSGAMPIEFNPAP